MKNNIRFGMVQGRLTQSPPGCLQWFPNDHWKDEFIIASDLGIDYIELIAETKYNSNNPIAIPVIIIDAFSAMLIFEI